MHSKKHAGEGKDNSSNSSGGRERFTFLSVFKWESRKGWDVLIKVRVRECLCSPHFFMLLYLSHLDDSGQKTHNCVVGGRPGACQDTHALM